MAQLDIQPINPSPTKLDIQPLDIQPLETEAPSQGDLTTEEKPKNFIHQAWDKLSEPLWEGPSRLGKSFSDYITDPSLYSNQPYSAQAMGFLGGAAEGAGNVLSGFTSPINLAATLATAGEAPLARMGFSTAARGLNLLGKAVALPVMAHGATRIFDPNATLADRGMGLAEIAGGATGFMEKPAAYAGPAITEPRLVKGAKTETPNVGPTVPPASKLDIKFTDKFEKYRQVPVGTKYTVNPNEKLPLNLRDAMALGFEYKGLDDNGKLLIEKTKESPAIQMPDMTPQGRSITADLVNLPRTLMASMDMSAPLRQGLGLIYKKAFWTALPDMFKAFGSTDFYNKAMEEIADRPMFRKTVDASGNIRPSFAEISGLKLTNLNDITQREESIMSSLADKIPGIGNSERAYTIFINKLRADTFQQMVTDYKVFSGKDMKANLALSRELATFVNTASGRGDLGRLENSARVLSSALFSPRLMASRIGMMAKGGRAIFDPQVYMLSQPSVRREYLKSLFSIAAAAGTFVTLGKLAGGEVETDPASSDFGKVRFGDTRIDPYGGFQQYITLAQRLMPQLDLSAVGLGEIGGKMKSTTTGNEYDLGSPKFGESNRADVLIRFLRSKTNPIINFGWGLMAAGKEISGKPMNLTDLNPYENAIGQRFLPMLTQDIYDLVNDESTTPLQKGTAATAAWFGMGTQTYGNK